jgi:hypothetical protein
VHAPLLSDVRLAFCRRLCSGVVHADAATCNDGIRNGFEVRSSLVHWFSHSKSWRRRHHFLSPHTFPRMRRFRVSRERRVFPSSPPHRRRWLWIAAALADSASSASVTTDRALRAVMCPLATTLRPSRCTPHRECVGGSCLDFGRPPLPHRPPSRRPTVPPPSGLPSCPKSQTSQKSSPLREVTVGMSSC